MIKLRDVKGIEGRQDPIILMGGYEPEIGKVRILSASENLEQHKLAAALLPLDTPFIDDIVGHMFELITSVRSSELASLGHITLDEYVAGKRTEFERYKQGEGNFLLQANVFDAEVQMGHIHIIGKKMVSTDKSSTHGLRSLVVCDEYDLTLQNRSRRTRLHDVLNRLGPVSISCRGLVKAMASQNASKISIYSRIFLEEAKALEGLLQDPLRARVYERLESGKYQRQQVYLKKDIIDPILQEIIVQTVGRGISVDYERSLREGKDILVNVDPEVFRLVYLELFNNAIKYGKRIITYGFEIDQKKVNGFNFGHNCGVGNVYNECEQDKVISQENLERIFEDGVRGNHPGVYSTGQGLAVVKRIVEAHGGKIRADPTKVRADGSGIYGANFQFGIPLAQNF